jgi:hypothetical protein
MAGDGFVAALLATTIPGLQMPGVIANLFWRVLRRRSGVDGVIR